MRQYSASDGFVSDRHLRPSRPVRDGRRFGPVFIEATAVLPEGRITDGDPGRGPTPRWRRSSPSSATCTREGATRGHAARARRPQGEHVRAVVRYARSARRSRARRRSVAHRGSGGGPGPRLAGTPRRSAGPASPEIVAVFGAAAARAHTPRPRRDRDRRGARRPHALVPSPVVEDAEATSTAAILRAATRFALEIAARGSLRRGRSTSCSSSVRGRCTASPGAGRLIDTVTLAQGPRSPLGVDVIDCSAGGFLSSRLDAQARLLVLNAATRRRRGEASRRKRSASSSRPRRPRRSSQPGRADSLAVAREALLDPHWAGRAAVALEGDAGWAQWPGQYAWWPERRAALMRKF